MSAFGTSPHNPRLPEKSRDVPNAVYRILPKCAESKSTRFFFDLFQIYSIMKLKYIELNRQSISSPIRLDSFGVSISISIIIIMKKNYYVNFYRNSEKVKEY